MSSVRPDWSWKPSEAVLAALQRGREKVRGQQQQTKENEVMASKSKKPAKGKKKLDGKKLAANRKPRDSVAQFIKDELNAGKTDVAKILDRAKVDFPKAKPTAGYVRFIAKQIGKEKQVAPEKREPKAKPAKKAAKKSGAKTTSSKKTPSEPSKEAAVDPAS